MSAEDLLLRDQVHHQLQDPSLAKANTGTAAIYKSLDSRLVEWTR